MDIDWKTFWCCLGSAEQAILNFMGDMLALPDPVVLKSSYDAVWLANIGNPGTLFYEWWMTNFSLFITEVVIGGITFEAVGWQILDHFSFNVFRETDDYLCEEPCRYSTGHFQVPP